MPLERNVGGRDRLFRAVLAVVMVVVAGLALRAGRRSVATVAAAAAVGLGINAVTCFCGLNAALGLDTTEE
ncbi:MAG: YgaP-like transmembrane domain [Haloplanus sp.]